MSLSYIFRHFFNPVFSSFFFYQRREPQRRNGCRRARIPKRYPLRAWVRIATEPTERNVHPRAWAHAAAFNEPAARFRAHGGAVEPLTKVNSLNPHLVQLECQKDSSIFVQSLQKRLFFGKIQYFSVFRAEIGLI